jgi:hypothetical protein
MRNQYSASHERQHTHKAAADIRLHLLDQRSDFQQAQHLDDAQQLEHLDDLDYLQNVAPV